MKISFLRYTINVITDFLEYEERLYAHANYRDFYMFFKNILESRKCVAVIVRRMRWMETLLGHRRGIIGLEPNFAGFKFILSWASHSVSCSLWRVVMRMKLDNLYNGYMQFWSMVDELNDHCVITFIIMYSPITWPRSQHFLRIREVETL